MTFASRTQFHVERPWGQRPSRGLLRDYKPSDRIRMELFEALVAMVTTMSLDKRWESGGDLAFAHLLPILPRVEVGEVDGGVRFPSHQQSQAGYSWNWQTRNNIRIINISVFLSASLSTV